MSEKRPALDGIYKEIPVGLIDANDWNPNEMNDAEFDALVETIDQTGMVTILQVVPNGKRYRLVGGEHRHRALKLLGRAKAPCVVLGGEKWQDEDLQKFETVKFNLIHGRNNPEKFMALYLDVAERHSEGLQAHFGFTDDDAWAALVGQTTENVESSLPPKAVTQYKKAVQKLDGKSKTADQLAKILQKVMDDYGGTVDKRFVYFDLGGKKHLHVSLTDSTFILLEKWLKKHVVDDVDADKAFAVLLDPEPPPP